MVRSGSGRWRLVDPRGRVSRPPVTGAPRLDSIRGCTIGLLDSSKPNASHFLDAMERLLRAGGEPRAVLRFAKTRTGPAPGLDAMAAACDGVINAFGD